MTESQVERYITRLIVAVGVSGIWFFRLDLSEGWGIGFFAVLSLLIGISMGLEIGKRLRKKSK